MKRLLFLVIVLVIGFYGVWPALSAYGIYSGLKTQDESLLESKVDWPSVRASFKESIEPMVASELSEQATRTGVNIEALSAALGANLAPKLVEILVETYMTPKGLVQLSNAGGRLDMEAAVAKLAQTLPADLLEQAEPGMTGRLSDIIRNVAGQLSNIPGSDKLRELFSRSRKNDNSDGTLPLYGLNNIKSFHLNSPTELELSVSKDPGARQPDLTAAMGFTGMDWKLVKVVPRFQ